MNTIYIYKIDFINTCTFSPQKRFDKIRKRDRGWGGVPPYQTDEDEDELDDVGVGHGVETPHEGVDDGHH